MSKSLLIGTLLHDSLTMYRVYEDVFDVPVHVCKERSDIALVGMDILKKCNYAQWHEWDNDDKHTLNFKLEIAEKD